MGNRKRGAMKMKLSTIAKTSLALGILTTGVMTTHAQSVDANGFNKGLQLLTDENKELVEYYKKPSFDFKNVNGFKDGDKFEFVDSKTNQFVKVDLLGKDKNNLKEGASTNHDVFVVKENNSRQAETLSIGGITKSNGHDSIDPTVYPTLSLIEKNGNVISNKNIGQYPINKKEISLKELDFKLRQKLMDEHGLYKDKANKGDIVVIMKDGGKYTFELHKKLQDHRMGDVIDATQIDRIDVEYK